MDIHLDAPEFWRGEFSNSHRFWRLAYHIPHQLQTKTAFGISPAMMSTSALAIRLAGFENGF
jgi:hypothetical protein